MTTIAREIRWERGRFGRGAAVMCGAVALWLLLWSAPIQAQNLTGSGVWNSGATDGNQGTWQLTLTKAGLDLNGNVTLTGPFASPQGNIYGTMSDTGDIHFGVLYNDVEEATFTGSVTGAVASGAYTTKDGDSGNWTGSVGPAQ